MSHIRLKKGEERRVRQGHPWIFSNEIDTAVTPLKSFTPGQEVIVQGADQKPLGAAYINPQSLICARIYSRDPDIRLDKELILQRLQHALKLRELLFTQPYYRLVFSEGDDLPGLVIDRYGDDFVVQTNTAGMEAKIPLITDALRALFPQLNSITLHNDSPMRAHEGLESYIKPAYGTPPDIVQLEENGVPFIAPLADGQKTGWFYDHRINRARLQTYAPGRRVLDVFSYVGGWGIQAAAHGAVQVDCIDSSAKACEFVLKNARLNQMEPKIDVMRSDVFDAFKLLRQQEKQYDLIILDPPAFIKRTKDRKEGLIAYQRINEAAFKLLSENGILISCSCSMHVSMDDLLQIVKRSAYNTGTRIQVVERGHQGPDHPLNAAIPETDYLKAWFVRKV